MMDKVVSQLDIITRTVCLLEKRVTENEDLVHEAFNAYWHYRDQKEQEEEKVYEHNLEANNLMTLL